MVRTLLTSLIILFGPHSVISDGDELPVNPVYWEGLIHNLELEAEVEPLDWFNESLQATLLDLETATTELEYHGIQLDPVFQTSLTEARTSFALEGNVNRVPADLKSQFNKVFTQQALNLAKLLHSGVINPADFGIQWEAQGLKLDFDEIRNRLRVAIDKGDLKSFFTKLEPSLTMYKLYKEELKVILNEVDQNFNQSELLSPFVLGKRHNQATQLKLKLVELGFLNPMTPLTEVFDKNTQLAIKRFQAEVGLPADGVVGKHTWRNIFLPIEDKIQYLTVNLERMRWFGSLDQEESYLWVNIPDFKLIGVVGDTAIVNKVIVGKDKRQTPVISSKLQTSVLKPYWHVPPTILREDVMPSVHENIDWLSKRDMVIIDNYGDEIDPTTVNWDTNEVTTIPYLVRQAPGALNALGSVKFLFPNNYSVYLHDTPSKRGFNKQNRALSSGCIRVEKPLELFSLINQKSEKWSNIELIDSLMRDKESENIHVRAKMDLDIHITYFTIGQSVNGGLLYWEDIYQRDAKLFQVIANSGISVIP